LALLGLLLLLLKEILLLKRRSRQTNDPASVADKLSQANLKHLHLSDVEK